jgi:hypothetical protein
MAARSKMSCRSSAARIASGCRSHSRVLPSTSVNRNVTTPEGRPSSPREKTSSRGGVGMGLCVQADGYVFGSGGMAARRMAHSKTQGHSP